MEYRTKLRWKAAALAALLLLAFALPVAADSVLRRGSTGDAVVTVQKKLKQWGYYTGAVDGIFGSRTEAAVRYFQRKNGLTADGIVGKKTAAALGITLSGESGTGGAQSGSDGDVYLLARCIHGEARGEPYKGQVAVGAVILNRVRSSAFPKQTDNNATRNRTDCRRLTRRTRVSSLARKRRSQTRRSRTPRSRA